VISLSESGEVFSVGEKSIKINSPIYKAKENVIRRAKEKCAESDEMVAIVWELWRGPNGAYRVH